MTAPIDEARLRELVLDGVEADTNGGCWLWRKAMSGNGYGQMKIKRVAKPAHREAYKAWKGPIPEGLHVLHSCDNALCVNPDHLSVGTRSMNMTQARQRGRIVPAKTFRRIPHGTKYQVLARVLSGEPKSRVAADYGIAPNSIRLWLKALNAKPATIDGSLPPR